MSGYGAHLLHGFQPHFLHPLNPAVSTASGTSPFSGGGAFVKPFPSNLPLPSAFAPPKCLGFGIDQVSVRSAAAMPSVSPGAGTRARSGHTDPPLNDHRTFSPRVYCSVRPARVPNPSGRTRPARPVRHCRRPPRMNRSRAKPARTVTASGTVSARRNGARKRPDFDVSIPLPPFFGHSISGTCLTRIGTSQGRIKAPLR